MAKGDKAAKSSAQGAAASAAGQGAVAPKAVGVDVAENERLMDKIVASREEAFREREKLPDQPEGFERELNNFRTERDRDALDDLDRRMMRENQAALRDELRTQKARQGDSAVLSADGMLNRNAPTDQMRQYAQDRVAVAKHDVSVTRAKAKAQEAYTDYRKAVGELNKYLRGGGRRPELLREASKKKQVMNEAFVRLETLGNYARLLQQDLNTRRNYT